MKLKKWPKGKDCISKSRRFDAYKDMISVWERPLKGYKKCFIVVVLEGYEKLKMLWEPVQNDAAFHLQAKTRKLKSRQEMYIVYLVKGPVPDELKRTIESDRYSMRKIVVSNYKGEDYESLLLRL